jgi:hypothetical protein
VFENVGWLSPSTGGSVENHFCCNEKWHDQKGKANSIIECSRAEKEYKNGLYNFSTLPKEAPESMNWSMEDSVEFTFRNGLVRCTWNLHVLFVDHHFLCFSNFG